MHDARCIVICTIHAIFGARIIAFRRLLVTSASSGNRFWYANSDANCYADDECVLSVLGRIVSQASSARWLSGKMTNDLRSSREKIGILWHKFSIQSSNCSAVEHVYTHALVRDCSCPCEPGNVSHLPDVLASSAYLARLVCVTVSSHRSVLACCRARHAVLFAIRLVRALRIIVCRAVRTCQRQPIHACTCTTIAGRGLIDPRSIWSVAAVAADQLHQHQRMETEQID